MNIKRIIQTVVLMAILCATTGFRFFEPRRLSWPGENPVIPYTILLSSEDFTQAEALAWIRIIRDSSLDWFRQGGSKAALDFQAAYDEREEGSDADSLFCSAKPGKRATIYAEREPDPDCTGESCVFLWSCGDSGALRAGDIQFNRSGYSWSGGPGFAGDLDLKGEVLHAIGHLLGLNHCAPGERGCSGNPPTGSVMAGFSEERSLTLTGDDRSGIRELYGVLDLPFPETGKYALSEQETADLIDHMAFEDMTFGPNGRGDLIRSSAALSAYSERKSGKTLREQTDEFFQGAIAGLSGYTPEELRMGIRFNTIGIYTSDRWIQDHREGRPAPFDLDSLNLAKTYNEQMRRASIDLLGGK